jgi:hypothetical protein
VAGGSDRSGGASPRHKGLGALGAAPAGSGEAGSGHEQRRLARGADSGAQGPRRLARGTGGSARGWLRRAGI